MMEDEFRLPSIEGEEELSEEGEESVHSEEFANIMNFYQNEFKTKAQGYSSRLPKCVNYMLGEANRLYLEKNFDLAMEVCFEAIKVYPENPEPYHLLSVIHEEKGDMVRAVDFLFIETQLNYKSDIGSWCKLAESFFKLGSYKNASYCYGRAIKCEKTNVSLLFKKAQCYDKLKDVRGAIKYYEKIYVLVKGQKEVLIKLSKLYARIDQQEKAALLIIDFLSKNSEQIDFEICNICCELLITKSRFKECKTLIEIAALNPSRLDSLVKIYRFYQKGIGKVETSNEGSILEAVFKEYRENSAVILSEADLDTMQQEVPVEILIKYCRCLMKSEGEGLRRIAFNLLEYAESLDPEEYLDVFLDIIDLYCEFNYFHKAIGICQKLATNESLEDKSVILMRMGILLGKMGETAKEIETYKKVLELNPDNKKARFRLSEIYEIEGKFSDAVRILAGEEPNPLPSKPGRNVLGDEKSDEEEDRIYLSDDDGEDARLGKRSASTLQRDYLPTTGDSIKLKLEENMPEVGISKIHKVDNLIKDIKSEGALNLKTRRRMVNIVELNEQFFVNVQNNIDDIMKQYDLDVLLLQFKKCELEFKSAERIQNPDFKCIRKALRLEQRKINFRESIYQLLLNESKGKLRSTFQGFQTDDTQLKKELNYLFIFKRKKNTDQESSKIESMFKESKNKSCVARKLSFKLVSKMKTIPDYIGFEKFVDIVDRSMREMYSASQFVSLIQVCDLLMKTSKSFDAYPKFQVAFHYFGFLANCKTENFEKAYIFFRVISKNLISNESNDELNDTQIERVISKETFKQDNEFEVSKGKHSDELKAEFKALFGAYSQADINKACFCMMNHLFNEFYQQENSHRIFFQKFQKQYEKIRGVSKYVNFICTNNYIMSGSYGSAREWLLKNKDLDSNPLSNFLLGFISLIESTNRNNENKIDMIHSAFDHFETYKNLSPSTKLPEVYYNMGRAFSHLSMSTAALKMFAKAKSTVEDRILQYRRLTEDQAAKLGKAIDQDKWRNFDLDYRKRHYYYESSFNEVVWHYKLNNKSIGNSLIETMFV